LLIALVIGPINSEEVHLQVLVWNLGIVDKESSSETNLRTNSLQEGGNDRALSQDSI